jgi:peptide/nickel transport system ATP-binding protein
VEQGAIRLNGTDIAGWSADRFDTVRGRVVSLIPQDPTSSLNPVRTVGEQVGEILQIHRYGDRQAIAQRVVELLAKVGLSQPELRARQYPHELSGGMKQRVLIAIAIALQPALIIADEPTSALDVTVQRRILDLIDELRREFGTAVLLVTHDLGVAADRAHRLVVLQGGRIQEQGDTASVLRNPQSACWPMRPRWPVLPFAPRAPWRPTMRPSGPRTSPSWSKAWCTTFQ